MVLVLDGGSTSALEHLPEEYHSEIMSSPLWTSQALFTYPEAVESMYRSYIESGADLISCMTYQQSNMTMQHVEHISDAYDVGMRIAVKACQGTKAAAVLTLGTHAAMLSNGAEYCYKYNDPSDRSMLRDFHSKRLSSFANQACWPQVPYIAFETLPDVMEAEVILDVLQQMPAQSQVLQKKIWISFSCSGEGAVERVLQGVKSLLASEKSTLLWGLGINCFKEDVADALIGPFCALLGARGLHAVVYPDAGRQWDAVAREFTGEPMDPSHWSRKFGAMSRLNGGRMVLGGCCQTGPAHVAAIRSKIELA